MEPSKSKEVNKDANSNFLPEELKGIDSFKTF